VTVAEPGGRPIAVTVDRGSTMRTWEVDSGQPVDPPRRLTHHRNAETATPGRRRTLLDTGGDVKARRDRARPPVTALAATTHGHLVVGVGRDVAVLIPD
jgi:hypothetical protein